MRTLVSCIIPVFNGERFLGEAIESVLSQTWNKVELLIIDDGSTDGSADVASSFAPHARCIRHETNLGPSAARNRGIAEAKGELVAFLDADDLWCAQKLEKQLKQISSLDLSFTAYRHIWAPELADEEAQYKGHPMSEPSLSYCISTLVARKKVFAKTGTFDESLRFAENVALFTRAVQVGARISVFEQVLATRRFHGASATRSNMAATRDAFLSALKQHKDTRSRD